MQLNTVEQNMMTSEIVYDSFLEQGIECDVVLPDYCPDILKILSCTAEPSFTLVQAVGAQLAIDGSTKITMTYLSEDSKIHTSEHKVAFSKTVELKSTVENAVIYYSAQPDYVNCRAVNRRRADIHGAFTISFKVISQKKEKVLSEAQGDGIQLLKKRETVSDIIGTYCRSTTIREEIELEDGNDSIKEIIRCSCSASVTDYKAISNKVIAKGEIKVDILYTSDNNEKDLNTFSFTVPISHIADIEGVDEDCRCDVRFTVASCEINETSDGLGVSLEAVFCTDIKVYRDNEAQIVSDCYSTMYECGYDVKSISCMQCIKSMRESQTFHHELKMPDGAQNASDIWCRTLFAGNEEKDGAVCVKGKLIVCMVALNEENEPVYFEQPLDIELCRIEKYPIQQIYADIQLMFTACRWKIDGDTLKLDADVSITGTINRIVKEDAVCAVNIDEEKGRKSSSNAAITVYFADEGESIWEIAKKYNTSVYAVMEENSLECDKVSKRSMLLIPMIQ